MADSMTNASAGSSVNQLAEFAQLMNLSELLAYDQTSFVTADQPQHAFYLISVVPLSLIEIEPDVF